MAGEAVSAEPVAPITPAAVKANDALVTIAQLATEAQPPAIPSTSGSWVGWSFLTWLAKNKGELKTLASIAVGLGSAWISVHLAGDWAVLVGGAFGLAVKFGLDWLDYGLTDSPK
jgi:hypothetical protein